MNNCIHIRSRLLLLSAVPKRGRSISLLECAFLKRFCTSKTPKKKKKEKIIVSKLQKYQAIRGREEGRRGEKERKRGRGTDVEAKNRDGSINRPPCSL